MNHLKTYKLFESNIDDINDIFMELRDDGYNIRINRKKGDGVYSIIITKTDDKYGYDNDGNFNYEKPFIFSEILDDIDRFLSTGNIEISCSDFTLYNKYEDRNLVRLLKSPKSLSGVVSYSWVDFISILRKEFGLATLFNSIELVIKI
jgi:hypothetical protein